MKAWNSFTEAVLKFSIIMSGWSIAISLSAESTKRIVDKLYAQNDW